MSLIEADRKSRICSAACLALAALLPSRTCKQPLPRKRDRHSSSSVRGFKEYNDARRFGFVRSQAAKGTIAPTRKTHNFAGRNFPFRRFGGLQDVETAVIQKERMVPEYAVQLRYRRMIVGQNLSLELVQGLFDL